MLALKAIRERMNLTQAAVAREMGVSRQTYNNWELGKRQADYESLLKLAELFNTTVENILTGRLEPSTLTENQEHLSELVNETHPEGVSAAVSVTMGLDTKKAPPRMKREDAYKKLSSLSDDEFREVELFADFIEFRRNHQK